MNINDYYLALSRPHRDITKIEFLSPDGSILCDITEDMIQNSSSLTVSSEGLESMAGTKRTATLVLDNSNKRYEFSVGKIWYGQQVRIKKGIRSYDGTEYWFPMGIFYISNPTQDSNPSNKQVTLSLVDKFGFLDGTINGQFGGTYILSAGDDLFLAVKSLLETSRGDVNDTPIDPVPPIISSYFYDKTYEVNDTTYSVLSCPYTSRQTGTYSNVLNEIATMLVADISYDCIGQLRIESVNSDISDLSKPILYSFESDSDCLINITSQIMVEEMYNHVIVTGGVLNGAIARGEATNTDPASPTNVQRTYKKTYTVEESKLYSDEQCQELADYYLKKFKDLSSAATVECIPMPHIYEGGLITINKENSASRVPYRIDGFTIPLGQTGTMSINASKLGAAEI